jgi:hypothetical protein
VQEHVAAVILKVVDMRFGWFSLYVLLVYRGGCCGSVATRFCRLDEMGWERPGLLVLSPTRTQY